MAEQSAVGRARSEASGVVAPWKGTARFEVLGCLGRGGMGIVYEVFDRQQHERVALKTVLHFDPVSLYRFKQEFRTLADVLHPNLVHLHELVAGDADEVFFTMELVEGTDFIDHVHIAGRSVPQSGTRTTVITIDTANQRLRKAQAEGPTAMEGDPAPRRPAAADFEKLRPALRQLVEGVRALHAAGKLHRDLKPSNVLVTPDGRVVVLDFGVATELKRRSETEGGDDEFVGTVTYMAPEQASGDAPLAASDWYSVGALLYEAIVGSPPFAGSSVDILTLKSTIPAMSPSECVDGVPEDLDILCTALLAIDPGDRPDAAEILLRLGAKASSDHAPSPAVMDGHESNLLVGREAELRALQDAFEATGEGRSVTVRVAGESGLGKSTLVHHYLNGLEAPERRGEVLVLRGRVYERESMPYKAIDSVIDALTRHLMDRSDLALPSGMGALAHLFPALRRAAGVDAFPKIAAGDPQIIRQLAFGALRELLTTLCAGQRVVVFIDDVQWGDTDSAALLVEVMRPPAAPPLLLVTTHRSEDSATSSFLSDLGARWPDDAELREIRIGPLGLDDARRLAGELLGSQHVSAQMIADGIAEESGGSPFLIEELVRGASAYHRIAKGDSFPPRPPVSLDELLARRASRLPDDARRLLEVVAVGGRPLPVSTVGAAAGAGEAAPQLVALLRGRRFVRASLREGCEMVETLHSRVRETIVAHLSPDATRAHHRELALVLEASPDADPEAIASHLAGAGDRERAAHYAERAAEQAIAKLAFAQAARLFQMTLDATPLSSPEVLRLARRVAEASEWAGYAEKSARAYLFAAERAPALERLDLERAATIQLIAAGRIEESGVVGRRILTAVGRSVPDSAFLTLAGIKAYRAAAIVLSRSKPAAPRELAPEERVRLEVLHAMGRGLGILDPVVAMYVKARYLVDAIRSGSRAHLILAAAAEASSLAAGGGRTSKREHELFETARTLSENGKDPAGFALYQITYGVCQYLRGDWQPALARLDKVSAALAAVRRWNANASVFALYSLVYMGDLREVKARTTRLLVDAERRGDLYTSVNLRSSHPIAAWLGSDDVVGARRHLHDSMLDWPKTGYLVQHWQNMLWEAEVELYVGDAAAASARLERDTRAIRRSGMFSVQLIAILTHFVRGRSAVASAGVLGETDRQARLAEAHREQQMLESPRMPWASALAAMLAASLASASGDTVAAEAALRRAIDASGATGMALHAASARRQLGVLLGGDAGAAAVAQAEEAMKALGVRVPERYAQMLLPGRW
jgi:eukaryotic-like serine/threonine-protein kinase